MSTESTTSQEIETIGKDRGPGAILGLSIITFGIYFLVWHGKLNAEIGRHDQDVKVSPGLSVLAMLLPISNMVSAYGTAARVRQMQKDCGDSDTISPVVALLLFIFLGIGYPLYVGSQVREHWHGHRRASRIEAETKGETTPA
jgi:drug/metabolite transporter (DMT)-like permease